MKKRRKLKPWVKITINIFLLIIISFIFSFVLMKGEENFEDLAKQCDNAQGHTCSYYEVRQYSLNK